MAASKPSVSSAARNFFADELTQIEEKTQALLAIEEALNDVEKIYDRVAIARQKLEALGVKPREVERALDLSGTAQKIFRQSTPPKPTLGSEEHQETHPEHFNNW
ncbi:hypothetical protein [Arcanobacterium haemolyticum]|uniref:Uncharacterized protein n=1 Tax=Arcanobacterium haemolyticum (strain ATCC 9345 / DSM 20595 / CCM 5947 / CCUG 17215 / LMG 16163 / NBRC 15585 / NCTC 8452 / 11018) TaxID=644284 RepID=D7BL36_ARCHD|nr:hypothetical protein [Arcanobacterium haemolyticum]ADH93366.1 hypothetical protein Arch_1683 [Arcanobacterium haemolyticum DSM 20595]SQH27754.1 Uncharacterised protein [Arcanobacterium haemolyticum]